MENYSSSNFDNLHDLQAVLDETASDIAQVLPDVFALNLLITSLLLEAQH